MLDAVRGPQVDLPIPPLEMETPCFVILEDAVLHNLERTAAAAGGIARLMPHVKTHRAPWLVEAMTKRGVAGFKAATPVEVEMALAAGAPHVVWAYPTVNRAAIARVIRAAAAHPDGAGRRAVRLDLGARGVGDGAPPSASRQRAAARRSRPGPRPHRDVDLVGSGRPCAWHGGGCALAGRFAGWHIYDGHIHDADRSERARRVDDLATSLETLLFVAEDLGGDVVAGGSYSFDLWPADIARFVSPGSFTYSSAEHASDLADLDWKIAGYVVATVISTHDGTATLDAGAKAISPDKPMKERFAGAGGIKLAIQFMNEEHVVVASDRLKLGERVALVPRHACTAAYLYERALVRGMDGTWAWRAQLGAKR